MNAKQLETTMLMMEECDPTQVDKTLDQLERNWGRAAAPSNDAEPTYSLEDIGEVRAAIQAKRVR